MEERINEFYESIRTKAVAFVNSCEATDDELKEHIQYSENRNAYEHSGKSPKSAHHCDGEKYPKRTEPCGFAENFRDDDVSVYLLKQDIDDDKNKHL